MKDVNVFEGDGMGKGNVELEKLSHDRRLQNRRKASARNQKTQNKSKMKKISKLEIIKKHFLSMLKT